MRILVSFCFLLFFLNAFAEDCTYQLDLENFSIQGTGYKFTNKVGVNGLFAGFKLNKNEKQKSIQALLRGLTVTVDLMSLDSGDLVRNKNMKETLFAGMLGSSSATVSVQKVGAKTIETQLRVNNKTQRVVFGYTIKNGVITAKGRFDALKYALGKQIAALKKRCGLLHTGADGKSVTWTDFDLKVTAGTKKACRKKHPKK